LFALKKTIAIIMMSIYGILSIGIHLNLHYCCGKIAAVDFINSDKCGGVAMDACCGHSGDGASVSRRCCAFDEVSFKLDESHQAIFFSVPLIKADFISNEPAKYNGEILVICGQGHAVTDTGPPGDVPLFLRHQCLVFYA
jgi:hypothetical protein